MQTHIEIPLELDFYSRPRNFGVEVDIEPLLIILMQTNFRSFPPTGIFGSLYCVFLVCSCHNKHSTINILHLKVDPIYQMLSSPNACLMLI
jgi:hypothetical protein